MNKTIYQSLESVFRDIFDEDVNLTADTTADDVDGWDSIHHIQLIMAIEKTFKIKFSTSEIAGMKKVGHLADLISSKMQKN